MTLSKLRQTRLRLVPLLLLSLGIAGCDKCGNRVSLNAPSLPNSCGAQVEPAR